MDVLPPLLDKALLFCSEADQELPLNYIQSIHKEITAVVKGKETKRGLWKGLVVVLLRWVHTVHQ